MKKLLALLVSIALLTGLLAGCAGAPAKDSTSGAAGETAWPRTVEDDYGHRITLAEKPERVVVLYYGHIETLIVLGHPPVGAALAHTAMRGFETLEQYADKIEIIDVGDPSKPNLERILEVAPDLIIGTATHTGVYDDLSKIAPTVLFNSEDWEANLYDYAECLGAEKEAEQYIAGVDALMTDARKKLSEYKDKTFFIAFDLGKNTFGAIGTKVTRQQVFFDDETGLGLTAPAGSPEEFGQISLESLAEFNPDYIFIIGKLGSEKTGYEPTFWEAGTEDSNIWKSLKAVQAGNVYFLDPACLTGSPLGIKLAIETIADRVVLN